MNLDPVTIQGIMVIWGFGLGLVGFYNKKDSTLLIISNIWVVGSIIVGVIISISKH